MAGTARGRRVCANSQEEPHGAYRSSPVAFWDERLSDRSWPWKYGMIEADLSRHRRAELIDKAAAAYILRVCSTI